MWADAPETSYATQLGDGARYAIFEGDLQEGQERPFPSLTAAEVPTDRPLWSEGAIMGFPRVRADGNQGVFWSACAIGIGTGPTLQRFFHLSTRPAPVFPIFNPSDVRDILCRDANPFNNDGADVNANGCKICVHGADGEVLATTVAEDGSASLPASPALFPALELVVVEGDGVYTLHPLPTPSPANVQCVIRKWQYLPGTTEIVPDPVNPATTVNSFSTYAWPAGLHDMGAGRLMLVWSTGRRDVLEYDFTPLFAYDGDDFVGTALSTFVANPDIQRYTLSGQAGTFARICVNAPNAAPYELVQTKAQTRGLWAGSFLAQNEAGAPEADSIYWLGVQLVSGGSNVPPGSPVDIPGGFSTTPYSGVYSGSVAHVLVNRDGAVVPAEISTPASPAGSVGVLPGCAIASQGGHIAGVGPSVAIYASAPGDTRTGMATRITTALVDVPSVSCLLITRREIADLAGVPPELPMFQDPAFANSCNQAVSIAQVLPLGQCIGTYMVNPYQVRTNLDIDADGTARFMCFERRAIGSFDTDDYKGAFPLQERPSGDAVQAAPYLLSLGPESSASTAQARGYVCVDGAHPVSIGGPQGLTGGYGVQPLFETMTADRNPLAPTTTPNADWTYGIKGSTPAPGTIPGDPGDYINATNIDNQTPGSQYTVSLHLVAEDEDGGLHRSVPTTAVGVQFQYGLTAAPPDWYPSQIEFRVYPFPVALFGLPNSQRAYIEAYVSGPGGVPLRQEVGRYPVPLTGSFMWENGNAPFGAEFTGMGGESGSGRSLYTESGELAADAPDPSACVAAARSRAWSVSRTDPRTVQYTKLLRRGYAPEWNGNLSVRVPDAPADLTAVTVLPDGRVLIFSPTSIHYTYGDGPSDTGQGAGFAEPAMLSDTVGCANKRSIVTGDFGCIFQGDRGFYQVDRQLALSYIGLPYEDTAVGAVYASANDGYRSEAIFYSAVEEDSQQQRWVYNYLRGQWSTFENADVATSACEREGRPLTAVPAVQEIQAVTRLPASIEVVAGVNTGAMSLTTGWLAMGKIQGYGRTWEVQLTGIRDPGSLSGLRVEIYYDYIDTPFETYDFDDVGNGQFKVRFRPRKQKSEAISFRFSEYVPATVAPDDCTGWRLDMCTVLAGVKAGLDKVAVTVRSS
jgi:hypothetical protein